MRGIGIQREQLCVAHSTLSHQMCLRRFQSHYSEAVAAPIPFSLMFAKGTCEEYHKESNKKFVTAEAGFCNELSSGSMLAFMQGLPCAINVLLFLLFVQRWKLWVSFAERFTDYSKDTAADRALLLSNLRRHRGRHSNISADYAKQLKEELCNIFDANTDIKEDEIIKKDDIQVCIGRPCMKALRSLRELSAAVREEKSLLGSAIIPDEQRCCLRTTELVMAELGGKELSSNWENRDRINKQVDIVRRQRKLLERLFDDLNDKSNNMPTGHAIVTFATEKKRDKAYHILENRTHAFGVQGSLLTGTARVVPAPEPSDVFWENFEVEEHKRVAWKHLSNSITGLLLVFSLLVLIKINSSNENWLNGFTNATVKLLNDTFEGLELLQQGDVDQSGIGFKFANFSAEIASTLQSGREWVGESSHAKDAWLSTVTVSVSVSLFNFAVKRCIQILARQVSYVSHTKSAMRTFTALAGALIINSVGVPLLYAIITSVRETGFQSFVTQDWYEEGGVVMQGVSLLATTMLFEELLKLLYPLCSILVNLARVRYATSRDKMVELYSYPSVNIEIWYAYLLKNIMLTVVYAPLYPPIYFMSAIVMFVNWLCSKIVICFLSGRPRELGARMTNRTVEFMLRFSLPQIVMFSFASLKASASSLWLLAPTLSLVFYIAYHKFQPCLMKQLPLLKWYDQLSDVDQQGVTISEKQKDLQKTLCCLWCEEVGDSSLDRTLSHQDPKRNNEARTNSLRADSSSTSAGDTERIHTSTAKLVYRHPWGPLWEWQHRLLDLQERQVRQGSSSNYETGVALEQFKYNSFELLLTTFDTLKALVFNYERVGTHTNARNNRKEVKDFLCTVTNAQDPERAQSIDEHTSWLERCHAWSDDQDQALQKFRKDFCANTLAPQLLLEGMQYLLEAFEDAGAPIYRQFYSLEESKVDTTLTATASSGKDYSLL
eukprot:CAMPEP_0119345562 /NCGR_PEP_ID=MMETSP1333-20130426/107552_1 /TAXON_ID=418940 /ORGANISM="Scyphosphaera apsteinii, Strain RCC1455" /LENGTH=945 /DNA_ID=CAMNT_0007358037 /DNA_START=1440 /DNA_END=4278 /DNA_ORIENTATION=-